MAYVKHTTEKNLLAELWLQWIKEGHTTLAVIRPLQHSRNNKTSSAAREAVRLVECHPAVKC